MPPSSSGKQTRARMKTSILHGATTRFLTRTASSQLTSMTIRSWFFPRPCKMYRKNTTRGGKHLIIEETHIFSADLGKYVPCGSGPHE